MSLNWALHNATYTKSICTHWHNDNAHTYSVCVQYIQCVQCTARTPLCRLNDCAFLSVYIFTLGDRWECVRGEKCETQLDGRYTLDDVHTLPLTLVQRSSHTTHRPLPPRLSDPPLPPHRSASLSFPTLYHQFKCSTLWEYGCAISLWWWEAEERRIMQKVKITILVQVLESVCVCTEMIKCGGNADVLGMLCHMTSLFPLSSLLDRAVQC